MLGPLPPCLVDLLGGAGHIDDSHLAEIPSHNTHPRGFRDKTVVVLDGKCALDALSHTDPSIMITAFAQGHWLTRIRFVN